MPRSKSQLAQALAAYWRETEHRRAPHLRQQEAEIRASRANPHRARDVPPTMAATLTAKRHSWTPASPELREGDRAIVSTQNKKGYHGGYLRDGQIVQVGEVKSHRCVFVFDPKAPTRGRVADSAGHKGWQVSATCLRPVERI